MSQESTDLAQVLAIQAEISALEIEVKGMEAFNAERLSNGYTVAYDEDAFCNQASQIRDLANKLRGM